jgi:hypothetical protein
MEAVGSEISVNYQTAERHIPVDSIIQKISYFCKESLPKKILIYS